MRTQTALSPHSSVLITLYPKGFTVTFKHLAGYIIVNTFCGDSVEGYQKRYG